jgi:stress response protein YsnF
MYDITTAPRTGFLFFDLAMMTQRALLEGSLEGARTMTRGAGRVSRIAETTRMELPVQGERVIQLAEEVLNVEARKVPGKTTRVRRFVIEALVERKVTLHDERVVVERRKPTFTNEAADTLSEKTVEATETSETPVIWKGVRVREEVVLRLESSERVETVRDTVRRDEVDIQQPSRAMVPREVKIEAKADAKR